MLKVNGRKFAALNPAAEALELEAGARFKIIGVGDHKLNAVEI